jgi:outer membrane biosynthesis protein TonB
MTVRLCVIQGLSAALLAAASMLPAAVAAQDAEPSPPAAESAPEQPAKPKPRPKPKPKPKPKPVPKAQPEGEAAPAAPADAGNPDLRGGREGPPRAALGDPAPAAEPPAPPKFAAPPVVCEPGQAVLYEGTKDFPVWVTRMGSVSIENPLRPLTPDVTRVLQLVVGDKIATAYGRDLTSLRRGASPGSLEKLLGGAIRWEAKLGALPDGFDIVSDAGATLAQMHFKECGTAPAAKALPEPVAKKEQKPKSARKPAPRSTAGSTPPSGGAAPGGRPIPQGAIPE